MAVIKKLRPISHHTRPGNPRSNFHHTRRGSPRSNWQTYSAWQSPFKSTNDSADPCFGTATCARKPRGLGQLSAIFSSFIPQKWSKNVKISTKFRPLTNGPRLKRCGTCPPKACPEEKKSLKNVQWLKFRTGERCQMWNRAVLSSESFVARRVGLNDPVRAPVLTEVVWSYGDNKNPILMWSKSGKFAQPVF